MDGKDEQTLKPILQIQHLTHTYGIGTPFQRSAVEDMSFDVYEGEFLGVIGHTGSGKSTLIQHLNGLLKPTEGQILLGGRGHLGRAEENPSSAVPGGTGFPVSGVPAL